MKRRSTHKRKEEEEEEDSSGDSDTATTKPTSRALKCLASFNKSATTTAGGGRGGRRDRDDVGGGGGDGFGVGGGTIRSTRSSRCGMDSTTGTTGDDDDVVIDNSNKKRKSTKTTQIKSNKKTTMMTKATKQRLTRYHGTEVDVSSCSSSSSSPSSTSSKGSKYEDTSSDNDDDGDEDYLEKGTNTKNTKKVAKKTKKGGKKGVEYESMDVLKAAEYPLTLRVAFIPRKRATSTTPTAFNSISNCDYAYHQYTSGLTTSSTLEEVYEEIDSVLPPDILCRVDGGKSLFYDSSCVSVHPISFGVVSKAKSKHVDPITDDNELLDAISCGGLKLETTPEQAEEPKTVVDALEAINEEEEEEEGEEGAAEDDEDESNNDSRFYYHLDLIVFCNKKNKNVVTGTGTRKSNPIEYIRINLLPLTVSLKGAKHNEESKYEYYPKEKANHNFGTIDIPVKDFCQGKRYCHIRHMMQEEYIKGDGDIRDNVSAISAIFIRTNAGSRNMIKITSTAHLLSMVDTIKSRARPTTADVGDSKAVVIYLSLGWKRTDDPPAGDFDLNNREDDEKLAAGSQQPVFHASPLSKKSHHQKNKEKRKASQTSSNEGLQIFHWLYSHKDSPYRHKLPLDFRPFIIEEYKDDTNERSRIMALIDDGIEDLEITDFPSIDFLEKVERLDIFFPLLKEYPPTNGGLPKFGLTPGKAGTRPKTMDEQLGEQVGGLVNVVGTLAKQLGTGHREAEFICITQGSESFTLPVSAIKPNRNNGGNAAAGAVAAVSPVAPAAANRITGLDVLKTFAVHTKASGISLFPRASPGDVYKYAFDGTKLRSDQFQALSLSTIIKTSVGTERTKQIEMTIEQKQTIVEEEYDVGF